MTWQFLCVGRRKLLLLHSHQLWHIFVTSAAYSHYRCVQSMMDFRLETPNFDEMGCL